MDRSAEGILAEYQAGQYLENAGCKIIDRNVSFKNAGELDIIALDKDTLVIVEVKYRSTKDFGHPLESITKPKIRKILKTTEMYIAATDIKYKDIRFDVISVTDKGIEHIKNAFYGYWS
jgi:putative endonuclease